MIWERQLLVTDKHLITKWMLNRAVFGWVKINSLLWTQTNWKNKCKFYTNKEQTRLKSNKTWTECWSKTFELVSFSEFVQFKNLIFSPKKPQNLFRINKTFSNQTLLTELLKVELQTYDYGLQSTTMILDAWASTPSRAGSSYLICGEEQEVVRWVSYHIALGWGARRRRTRVAETVQADQQDTEVTQGECEQFSVLSAVLEKTQTKRINIT